MTSQEKITAYIKSLPYSPGDPYNLYKAAKQWHYANVDPCSDRDYEDFTRRVAKKIGL